MAGTMPLQAQLVVRLRDQLNECEAALTLAEDAIAERDATIGRLTFDDDKLIELYGLWSEEYYRAGFMTPDKDSIEMFIEWLHGPGHHLHEREDYETKMVAAYRAALGEGE